MEKNSPTLGTSSRYVASTLSEDFQVICCKLHAQHPVGSLDVNISKLIKLKGNLAFPRNQVTLGGYYGGHPPLPEKMAPFFTKIRKCANYASTSASGKFR
jgi:hypothetical protein